MKFLRTHLNWIDLKKYFIKAEVIMMGRRILLGTVLFFMLGWITFAQVKEVVFGFSDQNKWAMESAETEIIEYKGKEALRIKGAPGERIAYLKDFEFIDGIIELDIAAIPYYTGLVFRVRSGHVYEGIYFRPQNSRHRDPVRRGHTVQYISNPMFTWYYLRETAPEKYEAAVDIPPDEWFHVKVVVAGKKAEVFVNDAKSPSLVVEDLKHGISQGSVGVWCGNTSAGTFANLTVTPTAPTLTGETGTASQKVTTKATYTAEQQFLFDVFKNRRSVRKFKPTPIPQEHIMKILDMARTAPTSGNQQPWKFLVVQNRGRIDRLRDEIVDASLDRAKKQKGFDPSKLDSIKARTLERVGNYLSAPVYVVVLTDKNSRYPSYNVKDGSLAAGYLILAARALGYGTVFITDALPPNLVKKAFEIPDNFVQICITPIGIPEEWPDPPAKKPLQEFAIFEKLIQGVNYVVPIKLKAIKLDPKIYDDYVGRYQLNEEVTVMVTKEDSRLFVQATGQAKIEIFPEKKDEFFLKVTDIQISFVRSDGGLVTELIVHQGGQDTPAKKIE
jgi:nitroreductase